MLISHVIPAYNASATIARTLDSVFRWPLPERWRVEAIVVDDGSSDGKNLAEIVRGYPRARLVVHGRNCGMCTARNSGISASEGAIVTILDADDELVPNWPNVMAEITQEWPPDTKLCYAACRNPEGVVTAQEPAYTGYLTLGDLLNERHSGEYIPLFRGDYLRERRYVDLGTRKSCGIVSYITFALDGPFWVSNRVLRIYNHVAAGSVTRDWVNPRSATESVKCYRVLFEKFGSLYRLEAPLGYRVKLLKLAVYMKLAGTDGYWSVFFSGCSIARPKETFGALLLLVMPPTFAKSLARVLKEGGLVRRYG